MPNLKEKVDVFFCAGKPEIKELLNQIKQNTFSGLELELYTYEEEVVHVKDARKIQNILLEVYQIAPEYPGSDKYTLNNLHGNHPYKRYYQVELYSILSEEHRLIKSISGEKEENLSILEKPSCYLFVEKTKLTMHNPFLRLANIIDTPGLGSITRRHDLITERHLRETNGIVIVLIRINYSIEKFEFWNLLAFIQCIFTYENRPTDNIFFLCNWQENLFSQEDGINKLHQVKGYLESFGFKTDKFYVANLDSWGRHGEEPELLNGFPSVAQFRKELDKKTTRLGSGVKLKLLKDDMEALLNVQLKKDEQELQTLQRGRDDKKLKSRIRDYKSQKNSVYEIEIEHYIREEERDIFSEAISDCRRIVQNVETGNDWDYAKKRLISIASSINEEFNYPNYFEYLTAKVNKIKTAGENLIYRVPINITSNRFRTCGQISKNSLESKINSAQQSWPNWWGRLGKLFRGDKKSTLDSLRRSVSKFFISELERIEKQYNRQSDQGERWFNRNQSDALRNHSRKY